MNSPCRSFNNLDIALLCCFVVLITFQPFFLHGEVIMMETGIHLPALNALFHGAMPYRDFFYLRGPLELYVPAAMMLLFGKNMIMLPIFYYLGTIATLLICVLIAKNLYRTRLILYLAIPVLVARTFPRISYNYWGGMRYALAILAVLLAIIYFRKEKARWIFLSGIATAFSFLTTAESGVSASFAVMGAIAFSYIFSIEERKRSLKALGIYVAGILLFVVPVIAYFHAAGALMPFFEDMRVVIMDLNNVFPGEPGAYPDTLQRFLGAFLPQSRYFKFMTPAFFYAAFLAYIVWQIKKGRFHKNLSSLVCIALYGLILYAAAFRKIEGHHFEMALQPEKLLYFFIAEEIFFFLKTRKEEISSKLRMVGRVRMPWKALAKVYFINFLFFALIASSLGYAIARYNNRFPAFQWTKNFFLGNVKDLSPLATEKAVTLDLERASGLVVPLWQAEEFVGVTDFLKKNTKPHEVVFCFPEVGNFNFLADRPFIGKFPIVTFSWMQESWAQQMMQQLEATRPRYVVMTKVGHRTFPEVWYFRYPKNRERFWRVTDYIMANYKPVQVFNSVAIYQLN